MIRQICALIVLGLLVIVDTEAGNNDAKDSPTLSPEETLASLKKEYSVLRTKSDKESLDKKSDLKMMLRRLQDNECRDGYLFHLNFYIEDAKITTETRAEDVVNLFKHKRDEMLLNCRPELLKKIEAGVEKYSAKKQEMKEKVGSQIKKLVACGSPSATNP